MEKLASFSEDLSCPVCFEMPKSEIFQCTNGHIICSECSLKVDKCPQCTLRYNPVKIRNRALESILDKMTLDCAYKGKGCKVKLTRKDVSSHLGNCLFGGKPLKLCEHIGYKCGFVMNTNQIKEAISHLKGKHGLINSTTFPVTVNISSVSEDGTVKNMRTIYEPVIVELRGHSFLVYVKYNNYKKYFSMHFLWTTGNSPSQFKAEFHIKTNNPVEYPDLVWKTSPIPFKYALDSVADPIFRFPQSMWKHFRKSDGKIVINYSVTRTTETE